MNTTNSTNITCSETDSEATREMYKYFSWWTEYFIQSIIGVAGIAANTVAIPVLCSKEMNSIFNRLLMFLAIFDNFFIICQMLEARRKMTNNGGYEGYEFNQTHEYIFGYFLFEFHALVLCCSVYTTVALSLERYRAVWRPVEYHLRIQGVNPWNRVIVSYVLPVVVFSLVFSIPKCFEIKFETFPMEVQQNESTNGTTTINQTVAFPTPLRLDPIYVIVYANLARLLVQGFIPFVSLSFLNYRIYWVMIRRRQMINRPTPKPAARATENEGTSMVKQGTGKNSDSSSSSQRKANEAKQALVLFVIVLLFFLCHTPRFIINLHEFLNLDLLHEGIETNCGSFPIWALAVTSVSHCLMTLNSSSNFYIYCFMCSTFRDVLKKWLVRVFKICICPCCYQIPRLLFKENIQNGITTTNGREEGGQTVELSIIDAKTTNLTKLKHEGEVENENSCDVPNPSIISKPNDNPDKISQVTPEKC